MTRTSGLLDWRTACQPSLQSVEYILVVMAAYARGNAEHPLLNFC